MAPKPTSKLEIVGFLVIIIGFGLMIFAGPIAWRLKDSNSVNLLMSMHYDCNCLFIAMSYILWGLTLILFILATYLSELIVYLEN